MIKNESIKLYLDDDFSNRYKEPHHKRHLLSEIYIDNKTKNDYKNKIMKIQFGFQNIITIKLFLMYLKTLIPIIKSPLYLKGKFLKNNCSLQIYFRTTNRARNVYMYLYSTPISKLIEEISREKKIKT